MFVAKLPSPFIPLLIVSFPFFPSLVSFFLIPNFHPCFIFVLVPDFSSSVHHSCVSYGHHYTVLALIKPDITCFYLLETRHIKAIIKLKYLNKLQTDEEQFDLDQISKDL